MKKVLKNNAKTKKYLESLPKIYAVGFWAHFGVREYYFSGKCDKDGMPLVWDYYDANGTCDLFLLYRLTRTTTGMLYAWTTSKTEAEYLAEMCEAQMAYKMEQHYKTVKAKKELEENK